MRRLSIVLLLCALVPARAETESAAALLARLKPGTAEAEQRRCVDELMAHHAASPEMLAACDKLGRDLDGGAPILRAIAAGPVPDAVRGAARYVLARMLIERMELPYDVHLAANKDEARRLVTELRERFASVKRRESTLGDRAEHLQFELDHCVPGGQAPEIEGPDLDGKPMKLSDHRGKVTVVSFWGDW